jgi:putative tryptophan/tyrosine transport system substrate-binding protein
MRRREVIAGVGVFAAVWPSATLAQQAHRVRRIGWLVGLSADDPGMKPRLAALDKELERLGWLEGRTVRIDRRYAPGGARAEELAKELVALQPDVILGHTVSVTAALQRHTRAIPIVFVSVGDPLGAGFIGNLARPDGNLTGLMTFEAGISGKWVAMLKEVMPGLTRAMFVANPKTTTYGYYLSGVEAAARALGLELVRAEIESVSDLESDFRLRSRAWRCLDRGAGPHDFSAWECHNRTGGPAPRAGGLCLQLPRRRGRTHGSRQRSSPAPTR